MSRADWARQVADEWRTITVDRWATEGRLGVGITYRLSYSKDDRLALTQPVHVSGIMLTLRILVANRLVVAYSLPGSIHFAQEVEELAAKAIAEASTRIEYMRLMVKRWDAEQEKEIPE